MRRRSILIAATLALLLPAAPPVHAASCRGASHAVTLSEGAASPGSGTTATTFTFSVRFASNAACAPSAITVAVQGVGRFPVTGSGDLADGVIFSRSMTLPPGVHTYTFSATAGTGVGEQSIILTSVNPDAVVVTAPTPQPTPSPTQKPTPPPTPPPTPTPAPVTTPAQPAPTPGPGSGGGTVPPPPPAAPAGGGTSAPGPSGGDGTPAAPTAPSSAGPDVAGATPSADASGDPADGVAAPLVPGGDGGPPRVPPVDDGPIAAAGDMLGEPALALMTVSVTLGLLLLGIVLARGRTVRDEEGLLAAAAAPGVATDPALTPAPGVDGIDDGAADGPIPLVRPLPPMRELVPPIDPDLLDEMGGPPGPRVVPGEEGVPRWLRPSVREARFAGDRNVRRSSWG